MAKALLSVMRGEVPHRRPMWMMRQAGRYLPEYRAVRAEAGSFLGLCYNPALAAEVTLQPLKRFDFDAAILFSDILVIPHALGLDLKFEEGEGPILSTVGCLADAEALDLSQGRDKLARVYDTVTLVKSGLFDYQALIGFCGAPWTVASYMVEGRSSNRVGALAAARSAPWFGILIEKVVEASIEYLCGQVRAGAEVLQIFDSWAGDLPEDLRERWVMEPIARIMKGVRALYPTVPIIVFARGIGSGHSVVARKVMPNCVGVEQDTDLGLVVEQLPGDVAVQGNLSPEVLFSGDHLEDNVARICSSVPRHRHVFNLGHGIMPSTPIGHVERLVVAVRRSA